MVSYSSRVALLLAMVVLLAAGCATNQPQDPADGGTGGATTTTTRETTGGGATTTAKADIAALQGYLDLGYEKMDQGAIAEGIQSFVTVLSDLSRAATVSDEAKQFGATAEEELTNIGTALNLAASIEWVGADKNQIAASTLEVGTPKGLNPSVTLTFNDGGTRTVVAGAPVVFEFVEGSGSLVSPVTTNDFGQANTNVTALDNTATENVIRATVVFRVKGFSYAFRAASRDFAYVPPVRKATILVLERSTKLDGKTEVSHNPAIATAVSNALDPIDFDFSVYNGRQLGEEEFSRVFEGDNASIRALALEDSVSYLVMVLNEATARQVVLNGKTYDLYTTRGTATVRIIRVEDGDEVYSVRLDAVQGQGGKEGDAINDGFTKTAARMSEQLKADLAEIRRRLLGG